jgi:hypothetical protein
MGASMKRSIWRISSCCMLASALACGSDDSGGDGAKVTFTRDVHPILQMKCGTSGCHDTPESFLPGHGAADVNAAYTEATRIWGGGEPVYELILQRVSSVNPQEVMPPSFATACGASGKAGLGQPGCLTQAEYDLIKEWVDEGRPK